MSTEEDKKDPPAFMVPGAFVLFTVIVFIAGYCWTMGTIIADQTMSGVCR